MDHNLCVIRASGKRRAREVSREKKEKVKKLWKLEWENVFSGDNAFADHKPASGASRENNREIVSSVQLVPILTKSYHVYDLLFINSQED